MIRSRHWKWFGSICLLAALLGCYRDPLRSSTIEPCLGRDGGQGKDLPAQDGTNERDALASSCVAGATTCWTDQGPQCVSLATDHEHCGGCNRGCAAEELCEAGKCVTCAAGCELCPDLRYPSKDVYTVGDLRRIDLETLAPEPILVVDLDGDGNQDFVVPGTRTNSLSVFHGKGDGTFALQSELDTCLWPRGVKAADMDGDGRLDLVVVCRTELAIHFDIEAGGYYLWETTGLPFNTMDLETASFDVVDLQGDTVPEIVIAAIPRLDPMYGDTARGGPSELWVVHFVDYFSARSSTLVGSRTGAQAFLQVGDFDGDGQSEVAWGQGSSLRFYEKDETKGLDLAVDEPMTGSCAVILALADLDEDGIVDQLCASTSNIDHYLRTQLGSVDAQGRRSFTKLDDVFAGIFKIVVVLGDINQDGHLDVVGRSHGSFAMLGDGAGHLLLHTSPGLPGIKQALALADVNGDGKLDLLAAHDLESAGGRTTVSLGDGTGTFHNDIYFMESLTGILGAALASVKDLDAPVMVTASLRRKANTESNEMVLVGNVANASGGMDETMREVGWPPIYNSSSSSPHLLRAGDCTGDGQDDVVYLGRPGVYMAPYKGRGRFDTPVALATGLSPVQLLLGDFTGDGRQDVLCRMAGGKFAMIYHTGASADSWATNEFAIEGNLHDVVVGDLNGDGWDDAVFSASSGMFMIAGAKEPASAPALIHPQDLKLDDLGIGVLVTGGAPSLMGYEPETAKGYVRYRLNQAGQLEQVEKLEISGRQYTAPLLVDFNQDGNLDVVFTSWSQRQVGLWKGNGQGQLSAYRTQEVMDAGWKIYGWGDVTGDGVSDLLVHNDAGSRLLLLQGELTAEACGSR